MKTFLNENHDEYLTNKRQLGSGGFGTVYRAFHSKLELVVAVKEIFLSDDPMSRKVVVQGEVEMFQRIKSDHVVKLIDYYYRGNDQLVVIMEYIEDSLSEYTQQMTPTKFINIFEQLCHGLYDIHRTGVMHRDIKPENIMYEQEENRFVYTDFGAACSKQNHSCKQCVGTRGYIDPYEHIKKDHCAIRQYYNDIFSLGATLYTLLFDESIFAEQKEPGVDYQVFINSCCIRAQRRLQQIIDELLLRNIQLDEMRRKYISYLSIVKEMIIPFAPNDRPSATDIIKEIRSAKRKKDKYMYKNSNIDMESMFSNIMLSNKSRIIKSSDNIQSLPMFTTRSSGTKTKTKSKSAERTTEQVAADKEIAKNKLIYETVDIMSLLTDNHDITSVVNDVLESLQIESQQGRLWFKVNPTEIRSKVSAYLQARTRIHSPF